MLSYLELRYNHNHDSKGRFSSGSGAGGSSAKALDKSANNSYNDSDETSLPITKASIDAVQKPDIFDDDEMNQNVQTLCKRLLAETADDPLNTERAYSISLDNLKGNINKVTRSKGVDGLGTIDIQGLDVPFISIHNHPSGETISKEDARSFMFDRHEKCVIVVGNNGKVYSLMKTPKADTATAIPIIHAYIKGIIPAKSDKEVMKEMVKYGFDYKEYT